LNQKIMVYDSLWKVHNNISEWVKFSDYKATAIIAINALLWASLRFSFADSGTHFPEGGVNAVIQRLADALFLLLSLSSVALALLSIHPTLKIGESPSHIFFAHIAKRVNRHMSDEERKTIRDNFVSEFVSQLENGAGVNNEITQQIWANSLVAWRKYRLISWAIKLLFGVIIITGLRLVFVN